jgi:hypothetical protein
MHLRNDARDIQRVSKGRVGGHGPCGLAHGLGRESRRRRRRSSRRMQHFRPDCLGQGFRIDERIDTEHLGCVPPFQRSRSWERRAGKTLQPGATLVCTPASGGQA